MLVEYLKQHNFIKFSIIFFTIVIVVLFYRKSKNRSLKKKEFLNVDDNPIDINNIVNSINYSKSLYKQLITKYHPDKYLNIDEKAKAEILVKEITKNKTNYKKLLELKKEASILFKD